MTRGHDLPGPDELAEIVAIPSAEELDETDRTLDLLAAGGAPKVSNPGTDLLRAAAMPGEDAELAGADAFSAALAEAMAEHDAPAEAPRREPRTFTVMGRVIAAKVAVIAAVATLGIAGAGAATGAVLRAVDDPPTTTEPARPEGAAADLAGAPSPSTLAGERADDNATQLSVVAATARLAVCDAATTEPGALALADAAVEAGTTTTEFCEQAIVALDAARQDAGTTPGAAAPGEAEDDPPAGTDPAAGTDPSGNGAANGNSPNAGGTPAAGAPGSGGSNGETGNGGNGGNGGTPNTNANPNAAGGNGGTPNTNANPNATGDKSGGNATPNANANAKAAGAASPAAPPANGIGATANPNSSGRSRPAAADSASAARPGTAATTRGPGI